MRRWLLIVVAVVAFLVMLYSCALPGDLPAGLEGEGLAGTYTVNGVDITGTEYSGTAVLRADGPDRYRIDWLITGAVQEGTGELAGDQLTVTWSMVEAVDEGGTGTGTYTVHDDGRLVGTRTVHGVDGSAAEELFPGP